MKKVKKYSGFTMMEMLLVMIIFIILFAMSVAAFSGLRSSIALNESVRDLTQDIRNAQTSAMLLERNHDERWLYGIGVDLSNLYSDGSYRVFRWCSGSDDYGDDIRTKSDFPNYDPADGNLSQTNGNLPANSSDNYSAGCERYTGNTYDPAGHLIAGIDDVSGRIEEPLKVGYISNGAPVAYIVFESITGNAFFYNQNGVLMNYASDGDLVSNPQNIEIVVSSLDETHIREVKMDYSSGKVELQKVENIASVTFPGEIPEEEDTPSPEPDPRERLDPTPEPDPKEEEELPDPGDRRTPDPDPVPVPVPSPSPSPSPKPDPSPSPKPSPSPSPKPDPRPRSDPYPTY